MRLRNIFLIVAAMAVLGASAPAAFANYHDVIRECYNTGQLPPGKYSRHDLKQARKHLPADIKEYSDCANLISAALAASGKKNGGGGGYNPAPNPGLTTPSGAIAGSQQAYNDLNQATGPNRSSVPPQISIAGSRLSPSTGGLINAAKQTDANTLPLPLILSLAALAAMAVLGAAAALRRRWPQIRRAPLRLLRR